MKMLKSGLVLSLGIFASGAMAELTLNVDGENVPVTTLMENCKTSSTDPAAQIACFNEISELLGQQSGGSEEAALSVPEALDAWRAVAQFDGSETGLSITGSDCNVQIVYYNNYFHISRRNVSSGSRCAGAFGQRADGEWRNSGDTRWRCDGINAAQFRAEICTRLKSKLWRNCRHRKMQLSNLF